MKLRLLLPAVLCLTLTAAVRADALDDDLAAATNLLLADKVNEAAARLNALEVRARTVVAANPEDAHAQYILGMAAMYAGHDTPAKTALDLARRLDPKNIKYAMGRAQYALYTDAPKEAVTVLQAMLDVDAKNLDLLEMIGHAHQAAEQYVEAQQTFQKAAALVPREARFQAEIAECLVSQHKEDLGLAAYQKALDLNPKYALALANIGQLHQNRKEYDKAVAAFTRTVELDPNDYRALAKLVQIYETLGKIKERDAARDQIFALRKSDKIDATFYCREQFTVDQTNILAFEVFELSGPMAIRYSFNIVGADGKTVAKRISLGSYLSTTIAARQLGQIKDDERMFHLDVYYDASHDVLGMFPREPAYEATRTMVKQYLAGVLKPIPESDLPATSQPATMSQPATRVSP